MLKTILNTILVHHRSPHHAQNSGYGRLVDYCPDATVLTGEPRLPYRMAKYIGQWHTQNAGIYNSSSVQKEWQLYKALKQLKGKTVVHYLNAERDIRYIPKYIKRRDVKFIGTFHKPPEVLKETITDTSYLKQLDGAICVGHNQVAFIKEWLGLEQVNYIPHGIDTGYFVPNISKKAPNPTLLFVGQHLRDFDLFNTAISKVLELCPTAEAIAIVAKPFVMKIKQHPKIQVYSEVPDKQLRDFYQRATVLFLPLKDATACNAVLEGMACGLPVVTSNVGSVPEYLSGTGNVLCDNSVESFVEALVALLKDEEKLTRLGKASREKVMCYDWQRVVKQIGDFYKSMY
ncbi:glycosyltransferase family 4 protein [Flavobacteriaceae bacterium GSB9]|nr:glycosyltransferase family 4 protein [Flavobacteriaceae bacterium GSB9]